MNFIVFIILCSESVQWSRAGLKEAQQVISSNKCTLELTVCKFSLQRLNSVLALHWLKGERGHLQSVVVKH